MHPPSSTCKQLARLHPQLRLAWNGKSKDFAVVQLYHISNAGSPDNPNTYFQRWNEGPVFSKNGDNKRDWDPLFRVPMFAGSAADFCCDCEFSCEHGIEGVFSGKLIAGVKRALQNTAEKKRERRRAMQRDFNREREDLNREMGDFLWHQANKTGEESIDVPWEFARDDVRRMYAQKERREQQLNDYFTNVPGM